MKCLKTPKEILKSKGINPSYQRIKILEYLQGNKSHPTVEMIYKDLAPKIPTLSKTTIYNTLKLFAEKGLVSLLVIDQAEIRVDPNVSYHAHFLCTNCNRISDIDLDADFFNSVRERVASSGYSVSEIQITLKGVCKECSKG
ncbi:MAG: Fur family transcriptional regulator, peroxide stress response regulator [bacterium]|nr:Fur family transcriptional regulator, peroxide stress response regulator [bacterium]